MDFTCRGFGLFLLVALVAGCAASNPKLELRFVRAELVGDNTYIGTRVRERALTLRFAARMQGLEGKDIPVRVYLSRNRQPELVTELHWKPDASASEWQWLPVFIPFSKLDVRSNDVTVYAVSPDAPDGYYDRAETLVDFYKLYGGILEGLWEFENFEGEANLEGDERGVRCSFSFVARGRQPHSFRASLVILNPKNLESMRVRSATSSFPVSEGGQVFENIQFQVRYSDIAAVLRVADGDDLIFYPIAEWDDGKRSYNLYIDGHAFGSPRNVLDRLETARDEAARQARNIEQALKLLQQAGR